MAFLAPFIRSAVLENIAKWSQNCVNLPRLYSSYPEEHGGENNFTHALGCKPLANSKECHRHPITLSHSRAAVVISRHKAFESRPPFIDQPAGVLWSRATVYIINAYSAWKSLSRSFGVPQRSSNESWLTSNSKVYSWHTCALSARNH